MSGCRYQGIWKDQRTRLQVAAYDTSSMQRATVTQIEKKAGTLRRLASATACDACIAIALIGAGKAKQRSDFALAVIQITPCRLARGPRYSLVEMMRSALQRIQLLAHDPFQRAKNTHKFSQLLFRRSRKVSQDLLPS